MARNIMAHNVIVTFTARPLDWILADQGSRDWRLDPQRAAQCDYLVCTQNRYNATFGAPTAPHGAAFLIGRHLQVVPSPEQPDRWLIGFGEYTIPEQPILNIWGKSGHHRYPVHYTTLGELGIDLDRLPPFRAIGSPQAQPGSQQPYPQPSAQPYPLGLADAEGRALSPTPHARFAPQASEPPAHSRDARARLDAILAQLDRIPDLPAATDPLSWDEHGLPR